MIIKIKKIKHLCLKFKLFIFFIFIDIYFIYYHKNYSVRDSILLKGRDYLNKCLNGDLLNRKIYKAFDNILSSEGNKK